METADLERAAATIVRGRRSHANWLAWQEETPSWRDEVDPANVGDAEHHRQWVEDYDHLAEMLLDAAAEGRPWIDWTGPLTLGP